LTQHPVEQEGWPSVRRLCSGRRGGETRHPRAVVIGSRLHLCVI
jgi:hypothetical protein